MYYYNMVLTRTISIKHSRSNICNMTIHAVSEEVFQNSYKIHLQLKENYVYSHDLKSELCLVVSI